MEPMIKIEHLDKTFKGKTQTVYALKDINLDIQKGDIFGIIGMSGAGKSTLIRCMNFLERPTSGTVKIDGKDLAALSDKELRKTRQEVAMIFQHFNLLQQIARALATNPKIILCDEATSALDPATTQSILKLLKDINRKYGITIVIITHEMTVVESICSHVAIIDDGQLAEVGTVEKVFTQPESRTAKRIIYQKSAGNQAALGKRCIRVVFDGKSSYEPVISNLIMECKIAVNIMFADTKDIDGKAYGHMILQLPEDRLQGDRAIYYLRSKNLVVEELEDYVI